MAEDEKPTSVWKKEISFRRKPESAADSADRGSGSIWKKEISLRKKAPDDAIEEISVGVPVEPELDAAIAALLVDPVVVAPAAAEPVAVEPPAAPTPAIEHDWLTKPLEEISEPPLEPVAPSPVSLVHE